MSKRHKAESKYVFPNAIEGGGVKAIEFPIGVASGQGTPLTYYCNAMQCPGYPYAATKQPHPQDTCGSILNSLDRSGTKEELMAEVSKVMLVEPQEEREMNPAANVLEEDARHISGFHGEIPQKSESQETTDVQASEQPVSTDDEFLKREAESRASLQLRETIAKQLFNMASRLVPVDFTLMDDPAILSSYPEASQLAVELPTMDRIRCYCIDMASELNVELPQIYRLVEGALQTLTQLIAFKELMSTSPIWAAFAGKFVTLEGRDYLLKLVEGIVNVPIRKTIAGAAQESVDQFEQRVTELTSQLEALKGNGVTGTTSTSNVETELQELGRILIEGRDYSEKAFGDLDHRVQLLSDKVDLINTDLGQVEKGLNLLQPNWRQRAVGKGKKGIVASQQDLEELDDFEDGEDEEEEDVDEDPPKIARKKAGRPPGPKRSINEAVAAEAAMRGRHKHVDGRFKRSIVATSSGRSPSHRDLRLIDQFIGAKKNSGIRRLLSRIDSQKLEKFITSARKGIHRMDLTSWTQKDQAKFIQWFFSKK
jgi:hypothetical protein